MRTLIAFNQPLSITNLMPPGLPLWSGLEASDPEAVLFGAGTIAGQVLQ